MILDRLLDVADCVLSVSSANLEHLPCACTGSLAPAQEHDVPRTVWETRDAAPGCAERCSPPTKSSRRSAECQRHWETWKLAAAVNRRSPRVSKA